MSDEGKAGETAPVDQKFSFRTAIYDAVNDTIKFSIPVAEFGGDLNLLQESDRKLSVESSADIFYSR